MRRIALSILVVAVGAGCLESGTLKVDGAEGEPHDLDEVIVIETSDDEGSPTGENPSDTDDQGGTTDPGGDGEVPPVDPECDNGEALCQGSCIDITQDDANCGDCGVMCGDGLICMGADCVCEMGELCDGECVDTTSNSAHCGACGNVCSGGQACVDGGCQSLTEVEGVLLATNNARAEGQNCGAYGQMAPAPPLEGDPNLHQAAQVHADDMAANNFFSHTGSDGSSFATRIGRTDYQGQPVGENIAAGNRTAEATVQQWIDSDGHCRNMMNPNATRLGVGYAEGGPYGTLWVQVFAR